jgi:hypothetical protein
MTKYLSQLYLVINVGGLQQMRCLLNLSKSFHFSAVDIKESEKLVAWSSTHCCPASPEKVRPLRLRRE